MRVKKSYIIAAIILVAVVGGYYYYKKKQTSNNQVRYVTQAAEKGTLTSSISASGNVIVDQSSNIDPTIAGTVASLAVNVGDKVIEGQFLFNIVNDDLTVSVAKAAASLKQSKDSVESAEVDVKSAKADYDAAQKKEDKTPGTYTNKQLKVMKDKIDTAEDKVTQAEKDFAATQADYDNTLTEAGKRRVTAPIDGTVNAVNIKNGDDLSKLSSGSTRQVPIIIGDLGTMKTQVQVNEVDIANVSIGQKAMLKFDAIDGLETSGKVEKMDSLGTSDQGVVTYNVTINFDSLDSRIKPEMSVSASIITDVKQGVLKIPSSALKNDNSGDYVEVLADGATTPERKSVQAGLSNGTDIEMISGVSAGDKVVTQTINSSAATSTSTSSTNRTGGELRIPGLGGSGRPD